MSHDWSWIQSWREKLDIKNPIIHAETNDFLDFSCWFEVIKLILQSYDAKDVYSYDDSSRLA